MLKTSTVKNELAKYPLKKNCCNLAELYGLLSLLGTLEINNKRVLLKFTTENETLNTRLISLLRKTADVVPEIDIVNTQLKKQFFRILLDAEKSEKILNLCYNYSQPLLFSRTPKAKLLKTRCCKKAFLRASFLGSGAISSLEKTYHLEFVTSNEEFAHILQQELNFFSFNAKIITRRDSFVIYIKESEKISEFFSLTGAHVSMLSLTDIRMVKEIRNQANRQTNCDEANLSRSLTAAFAQIESIEHIKNNLGLDSLSAPLKYAAQLRMEYPEASLSELCEYSTEPITKSGMNHRLRRLKELSEHIKQQNKGD